VAVHEIGEEYRFFDPNFGVFEYSKDNLRRALQYLFWAPLWKDEEGQDTDMPVYRRRTTSSPRDPNEWSQMSYTIFTKNT
jgi:primase-polymerase (primpol)-like protein